LISEIVGIGGPLPEEVPDRATPFDMRGGWALDPRAAVW